jgi:hypothetical protein
VSQKGPEKKVNKCGKLGLTAMKFSVLNAEINIVSSSYNLQINFFLLSLKN